MICWNTYEHEDFSLQITEVKGLYQALLFKFCNMMHALSLHKTFKETTFPDWIEEVIKWLRVSENEVFQVGSPV